jgi:hypothetical protein
VLARARPATRTDVVVSACRVGLRGTRLACRHDARSGAAAQAGACRSQEQPEWCAQGLTSLRVARLDPRRRARLRSWPLARSPR